ncbi:DNA pol B 2 domain-containing protein [Aphis craccivora]|uniref:DNA pol B 2 domain-containing protein n=1 Tax=Aphis craccivora TaxID=307492 RepID=A0A6G0XIJ3_APHCR|nr:DNA pol B 2 domain-containing protein [Aphis craccivora]
MKTTLNIILALNVIYVNMMLIPIPAYAITIILLVNSERLYAVDNSITTRNELMLYQTHQVRRYNSIHVHTRLSTLAANRVTPDLEKFRKTGKHFSNNENATCYP